MPERSVLNVYDAVMSMLKVITGSSWMVNGAAVEGFGHISMRSPEGCVDVDRRLLSTARRTGRGRKSESSRVAVDDLAEDTAEGFQFVEKAA